MDVPVYKTHKNYFFFVVLGIFLGNSAWSAPFQDCEQCVGCPYHVDGQCITNPVYWGYYEPNWRHWPGQPPQILTNSVQSVPKEASEVEIPKPTEEEQIIIQRRKNDRQQGQAILPESNTLELDSIPKPPLDLTEEDVKVDPFQDDEAPAVLPDGIDEADTDEEEALDDELKDLLDDVSQKPNTSGRSQTLTRSRSGRRRHPRQVTQSSRHTTDHQVAVNTNLPRDSQIRRVSTAEPIAVRRPLHANIGNPLRRTNSQVPKNTVADNRRSARSNPLR